MKKITVTQIMAWGPCDRYPEERVKQLIGRGKTPLQILNLKIPAEDRLWAVLREEIIPAPILHELACDFAQAVAHLNPDPRVQAAIDAKRAWLRGAITDKQLAAAWAAARDAARDAAWDAWDAARDAARAAAWAAMAAASAASDARYAASAAALGAASAAQIRLVRKALADKVREEI